MVAEIFNGPITVSLGTNILNDYSSYTYRFTLYGVDPTTLVDPNLWRMNDPTNIIIRSGGKGDSKILLIDKSQVAQKNLATSLAATVSAMSDEDLGANKGLLNQAKATQQRVDDAPGLIDEFNQSSPGRFDMYFDNLEIESLFTFTPTANVSLPKIIKFSIVEPYSVNGFFEALQAVAIATGNTSYANTIYILKIDFIGYPAVSPDDPLPSPTIIGDATRYFPIKFKSVDLSITEQGTRYECECIPYNEMAFGIPNILKKSISMEGETVGEMLENLIEKLNKILSEDAEKSFGDKKYADQFEIKFPSIGENGGLDFKTNNDMYKSLILTNKLQENFTPQQNDPVDQADGTPPPDYDSKKPVVQVSEKQQIHEVIASVIRDSKYVENLLANLMNKELTGLDEYGFVNYFVINTNVEYLDTFNPMTFQRGQKITYVVSPYRVYITYIPGFDNNTKFAGEVRKIANRTYNYLYTGKNIDLINFNLKFSNHYFQSLPAILESELYNSSIPSAARNGNDIQFKSQGDFSGKQVPNVPTRGIPIDSNPINGSTGNTRSYSPYRNLARNLHQSLLNNIGMAEGTIDIIGDPFYINTSVHGNDYPASTKRGINDNGEAECITQQLMIIINFRNPIDIGEDGFMKFKDLVTFSGVFRVNSVSSSFKNGIFTQTLHIMRVPGQPDATSETPSTTSTATSFTTRQNPDGMPAAKSTDANDPVPALTEQQAFNQGISGFNSSLINAVNVQINSIKNA